MLEETPADLKAKALRSLGSLPSFSPILTRLLSALETEDVSFAALGDLIEKDAVVAANILHLVNSALSTRLSSISSVRHAISILGANKLRNVVLGMSIARAWNRVKMPNAWSMARFNMHSAAVAVLSDLLAQQLPVEYPEGAFVAGLLHDTGHLLIAWALPQEYERILGLHTASDRPMTECEVEILGFTHAELSAEALKYWKLAGEIQIAARDHHSGSPAQSNGGNTLSRLIDAANQHANSCGLSILARKQDVAASSAVESLGLEAEKLQALLAEFHSETNAMAMYFR